MLTQSTNRSLQAMDQRVCHVRRLCPGSRGRFDCRAPRLPGFKPPKECLNSDFGDGMEHVGIRNH